MHSIALILTFVTVAIARSTYTVPPFQAYCRNIKFSSVSWTADCDNGTENWKYNARYWGECVGVTAANTLACGSGCVSRTFFTSQTKDFNPFFPSCSGSANWICRNCTANLPTPTGPTIEEYYINCNCNNVHSQIDLGTTMKLRVNTRDSS